MGKINKQKTIVVVLTILLTLTIGYIVFDKYQQNQTQKQISLYQQGMQNGYEQAITQLVKQALTCQQVPVKVQNKTINMIAVDCLKKKS